MFEQLNAPDHVIAMHLSGKMTGDDIKHYKSILDESLKKHERLALLVDFTDLSDMTADALFEGTKADLEFLSHVGQFSRCAFVTDKEWPQVIAGFIDPLFPPLEIEVFKSDQREQAIKWAAEIPQQRESQGPAFRFLATNKPDVIAFEINGMISSEGMPAVIEGFESSLEGKDKVRVLNRIRHFGGFDPAIFMQGGLFSMKMAAIQKVERYAIVGAPGWMTKAIAAMNPVFADMEMRTFPADREAEAWAWLGAKSAE